MNLFGGAVELKVPCEFTDASQFRQIPDNQEVFLSGQDNESIIVEVLEFSADMNIEAYFVNLAEDNDSEKWEILENKENVLFGTQLVSKFNQETRDLVYIFMALIRYPQHNSDFLITWNLTGSPNFNLDQFKHFANSFDLVDSSILQ